MKPTPRERLADLLGMSRKSRFSEVEEMVRRLVDAGKVTPVHAVEIHAVEIERQLGDDYRIRVRVEGPKAAPLRLRALELSEDLHTAELRRVPESGRELMRREAEDLREAIAGAAAANPLPTGGELMHRDADQETDEADLAGVFDGDGEEAS